MRRGLLLLIIALAGCGKDRLAWSPRDAGGPAAPGPPPAVSVPPPPAATPTIPADETPSGAAAPAGPAFEGTAGNTDKAKKLPKPAILKTFRTAQHPGFDRFVVEFAKEVPGYHLEYIDRPIRRCGSGDTVPMDGDGFLQVKLDFVQAHTEMGDETIPGPDRHRKLSLGVMRELVMTCDFEGQVVWVVGVSSPNKYRVLELSNPPRLVVDVLH